LPPAHRVVGRVLLGAEPWDDWAFGPVAPLNSFLDVPTAVANAGFLNPQPGNDFKFPKVSATFPGVIIHHRRGCWGSVLPKGCR
jgi:hypothetical protein